MRIYKNKFHSGHIYIDIGENEADDIEASRFDELIAEYGKPLQAMIPSDAQKLAALLLSAGFELKRRCFELDVCAEDLRPDHSENCLRLEKTCRGEPLYESCAEHMYLYYRDTHEAVNPLTAAPEEFCARLPDTAVCAGEAAAFIEGNEIAYVCKGDEADFEGFAAALIGYMLRRYDRIVFEADDTDPAAMILKGMFSEKDGVSYDTYIRPLNKRPEAVIRRVRPGDEAALAFVQTESWKSAFAEILDAETLARLTEITRATEMYRTLIEKGIGNGYLMTIDGKPHCIAWWDAARDPELAGKAEIISIHSLKTYRRRGYGRMMMERMFFDIRAAGYDEAALWVFTENTPARAFYEALGFYPSGSKKPALGTEEMCYEIKL